MRAFLNIQAIAIAIHTLSVRRLSDYSQDQEIVCLNGSYYNAIRCGVNCNLVMVSPNSSAGGCAKEPFLNRSSLLIFSTNGGHPD